MAPDAKSISQEVADLIAPILEDMGFELVDVEFLSSHGRWVLRLFVDREGGITLDECAMLSREFGTLLDVKELILHEYVLEVSSPGIERPLKRIKDYFASLDKTVKIRTMYHIEGRRNFVGVLKKVEGEVITLLVDGSDISFPIDSVEKANLVHDF